MLYTDEEKMLTATAEPGQRRSRIDAYWQSRNIARDFFPNKPPGRILEFGPGQYDFLDCMKQKGFETFAVENKPVLVELGRLRGHRVIEHDYVESWPDLGGEKFEGIYSRAALSVFRYPLVHPSRFTLQNMLDSISSAVRHTGWLWISPHYSPTEKQLTLTDDYYAVIEDWKMRTGISTLPVDPLFRASYLLDKRKIIKDEVWLKNCELHSNPLWDALDAARSFAVWGRGELFSLNFAATFLNPKYRRKFSFFIESDICSPSEHEGIPVYPPKSVAQNNPDIIFVAALDTDRIFAEAESLGIRDKLWESAI